MKPLHPGVPDLHSLHSALAMGYVVTPTGLAWLSVVGKKWQKPDGSLFPLPALVIVGG